MGGIGGAAVVEVLAVARGGGTGSGGGGGGGGYYGINTASNGQARTTQHIEFYSKISTRYMFHIYSTMFSSYHYVQCE